MTEALDADPVSALMRVLDERWVMTLALTDTSSAAQFAAPYPTPLFYALAPSPTPQLIFASDPASHHGRLLGAGPTAAAAAVYRETEDVQAIAGAQLRGFVVREDRLGDPAVAELRARYLERHPQAAPALASGRHHVYALTATWAKLTDNQRLGLGVHRVLRFDAAPPPVEQSSA